MVITSLVAHSISRCCESCLPFLLQHLSPFPSIPRHIVCISFLAVTRTIVWRFQITSYDTITAVGQVAPIWPAVVGVVATVLPQVPVLPLASDGRILHRGLNHRLTRLKSIALRRVHHLQDSGNLGQHRTFSPLLRRHHSLLQRDSHPSGSILPWPTNMTSISTP